MCLEYFKKDPCFPCFSSRMAPPLGLMIKLGSAKEIFYLQEEVMTSFEDVYILSASGKKFGFNKCTLASLSWFCKDLFLDLAKCPISNLDETIYVTSEFSNAELQALRVFFQNGKLPASQVRRTTSFSGDSPPIYLWFYFMVCSALDVRGDHCPRVFVKVFCLANSHIMEMDDIEREM